MKTSPIYLQVLDGSVRETFMREWFWLNSEYKNINFISFKGKNVDTDSPSERLERGVSGSLWVGKWSCGSGRPPQPLECWSSAGAAASGHTKGRLGELALFSLCLNIFRLYSWPYCMYCSCLKTQVNANCKADSFFISAVCSNSMMSNKKV